MKKLYLLLLVLQLQPCFGQDSLFRIVYYNQTVDLKAYCLCRNYDSTFFIGGMAFDADPFIMKISGNGEVLWNKTFNIQGSFDMLTRIILLKDSSLILGGSTSTGIFISRNGQEGDTLWAAQLDYGEPVELGSICETTDNGILVVSFGETGSGACKIDSNGNKEWGITFPGVMMTRGVAAGDSGFMLIGSAQVVPPFLISYIRPDGTLMWTKTQPPPFEDRSVDIMVTGSDLTILNENSVIEGYSLATITTEGFCKHEMSMHNPAGLGSYVQVWHPKPDSGFIFTRNGPYGEVINVDKQTNFQWAKSFWMDIADAGATTDTSCYVLGNGPIFSDIESEHIGLVHTSMLNESDCSLWPEDYDTSSFSTGYFLDPYTLVPDSGGVFQKIHPEISSLSILTRYGCPSVYGQIAEPANLPCKIAVIPNPVCTTATMTVEGLPSQGKFTAEIYDLTGRMMISIDPVGKSFTFDRAGLPAGLYIILIKGENYLGQTRFIISD